MFLFRILCLAHKLRERERVGTKEDRKQKRKEREREREKRGIGYDGVWISFWPIRGPAGHDQLFRPPRGWWEKNYKIHYNPFSRLPELCSSHSKRETDPLKSIPGWFHLLFCTRTFNVTSRVIRSNYLGITFVFKTATRKHVETVSNAGS